MQDRDEPTPDPPMSAEEEAAARALSPEELERIDRGLLSHAGTRWRKVAYIVGATMSSLPDRTRGIPDLFYAQRVRRLVELGLLESDGDLRMMARSEVRLPSDTDGET
jgi:Protein of unknown function